MEFFVTMTGVLLICCLAFIWGSIVGLILEALTDDN